MGTAPFPATIRCLIHRHLMIGGGLGVAIACAAYVMWRSGLFSTPLNVIGAVSGVAIIGAQLSVAPAMQSLHDVLTFFPIVFWIWMIWAGIVCWRRTPATDRAASLSGPRSRRR